MTNSQGKFAPSRSGKQGKCYHSTGTPSNACGCSMIFHDFPLSLTVNHPEMIKYHSTIFITVYSPSTSSTPDQHYHFISFFYQPLNIQTYSNPSLCVFPSRLDQIRKTVKELRAEAGSNGSDHSISLAGQLALFTDTLTSTRRNSGTVMNC